jgi:hypothetical protein
MTQYAFLIFSVEVIDITQFLNSMNSARLHPNHFTIQTSYPQSVLLQFDNMSTENIALI